MPRERLVGKPIVRRVRVIVVTEWIHRRDRIGSATAFSEVQRYVRRDDRLVQTELRFDCSEFVLEQRDLAILPLQLGISALDDLIQPLCCCCSAGRMIVLPGLAYA